MATRIKASFAGIEFSGFDRGDGRITVPVPALKKIVGSGKITVECTQRLTDDYAGDAAANFGRGVVDPQRILTELDDYGKPWLCYLNIAERQIRYCPMQSLGYNISEKDT